MSFWSSLATKAGKLVTELNACESSTSYPSNSNPEGEENKRGEDGETTEIFQELSNKLNLSKIEESYKETNISQKNQNDNLLTKSTLSNFNEKERVEATMKDSHDSFVQGFSPSPNHTTLTTKDTIPFTLENISKVCLILSCLMYELEEKENQLPTFLKKLHDKKANYTYFQPDSAWLSKMNDPTLPKYCIVTFENWPLQIVAIRGTRMSSTADWAVNLDTSVHFYQNRHVDETTTSSPSKDATHIENKVDNTFKGLHRGFCLRANAIPSELIVKELGFLQNGKKLTIFTGHSLGGAVASVLSLPFLRKREEAHNSQTHILSSPTPPDLLTSSSLSSPNITNTYNGEVEAKAEVFAITFGSPSILHKDFFSKDYEQMGKRILRFHFEDDHICPSLSKENYEPFETSICLRRSGRINYHPPTCSEESLSVMNTLDHWHENTITFQDAVLKLSQLLSHHSCTNYYDFLAKSESKSKRFVNSLIDAGLSIASTTSVTTDNDVDSSSIFTLPNSDHRGDLKKSQAESFNNLSQQSTTRRFSSDGMEKQSSILKSSLTYVLREAVDSYSEKVISNIYSSTVKQINRGLVQNPALKLALEN